MNDKVNSLINRLDPEKLYCPKCKTLYYLKDHSYEFLSTFNETGKCSICEMEENHTNSIFPLLKEKSNG